MKAHQLPRASSHDKWSRSPPDGDALKCDHLRSLTMPSTTGRGPAQAWRAIRRDELHFF